MVSKWEIYFCDLNPTKGSEQRGTRPVIIVSNDAVNNSLPITTVLPLSTLKQGDKIYPTEVMLPANISMLPKDSVVMVQQIRTVSQERLINKVGALTDNFYKEKILYTIREYFEV